ncbi:hypothetical protein ACSAMQ_19340, partial [Lysobacter sp. 1R34A]
ERAVADWRRAHGLLAASAPRSRDRVLLDSWVRTQVHLGARAEVAHQIEWLRERGYRHPDFIAFYAAPTPQELLQ